MAKGFKCGSDFYKTLLNKYSSKELLWENASPTSAFAKNTVTVSGLDNYDFYCVVFKLTTTNVFYFSVFNPCGLSSIAEFKTHTQTYNRNFIFTGLTQIDFDEGVLNGAVDNTAMIPYKIYGIKGVSE